MSLKTNQSRYFSMGLFSLLIFGLLPIFWSMLRHVDCQIILFHRCFWTFITAIPIILYSSSYKTLFPSLKKKWPYLLLSAAFIATNWFTYVFAVNNNYVFEASLAYFISPLVSLLVSILFLNESMTRKQLLAIILVSLAILYLFIAKNILPKYALIIALSFSFYGSLGHKIQIPAIFRLMVEGLLALIFFLLFFQSPQYVYTHFKNMDAWTQFLLITSGPATLLPLAMYVTSIRHIKFSTLGILSFIMPTTIFLVGIFYFREELDREKLFTILFIWPSIGLYIFDLVQRKKEKDGCTEAKTLQQEPD